MWCEQCDVTQDSGKYCLECGEEFQVQLPSGVYEDLVMIKSLKYGATSYDEDECIEVSSSNNDGDSDDSAISILYNNGDQPFFYDNGPLSISVACDSDGPPLEQREDILEMKAIPARLRDTLNFNDETKLYEVIEQLKARENIDCDMESEIENIRTLENNKKMEDVQLLAAASTAREMLTEARQVAKDGETTLKRAMEVIEVALPPFTVSCAKSYEVNDLSEEVKEEIQQYEQCLMEKRKAVLNFKLGQTKSVEAYQHLEKCIQLAEADVKKMCEKKQLEESKERMKNFISSKKEMDDIIHGELDEVQNCLRNCSGDLHNINTIQEEQQKRYSIACKKYEKCERGFDTKININRHNQEELRVKLNLLEQEEKKLTEGRKFQQQVQERAKQLNEEISKQLIELHTAVSSVQLCTTTSLKVMELMKDGGGILFSASIKAEEKYLGHLQDLDIEAKTKWRNALATSAVENKLCIDNTSINIAEYEEKYKQLKFDLKKAVQQDKRLECERLKKEMKEYKNEMKCEEKKKKQAEESLTQLLETISTCDEELMQLDRIVDSVDTMYKWHKQEIDANVAEDMLSSIEFSENEDSGDDD